MVTTNISFSGRTPLLCSLWILQIGACHRTGKLKGRRDGVRMPADASNILAEDFLCMLSYLTKYMPLLPVRCHTPVR
jgi:hypothetical protein